MPIMEIQQARILIRKINSLFKSMDLDEDPAISTIERDLMLSYLRQLYGIFLDSTIEGSVSEAEPALKADKKSGQPVDKHNDPQPQVAPRQEETPPVKEPAKPQVAEIPVAPARPQTPPPPSEPSPAEEVAPAPVKTPPVAQPTPSSGGTRSHAIEQLFSFKKATELSEKLSESPVADLSRAMSINDRLLYMNELFGRDIKALEESLNILNRFESLDGARSFLKSLAEQYNWADEERSEIAQSFIKLVRRRYLH